MWSKRKVMMAAAVAAGVAVLSAAGLWAAEKAKPAPPQTPRLAYGKPKKLVDLADRRIDESSGLACGRRNKDVFWTHNDSGGRARVYAINRKGQTLAALDIASTIALDWEDMCSAKIGTKCLLLLADTGNNGCIPRPYRLYAVAEPQLDTSKRNVKGKLRCGQVIEFEYDGGWFDCESVAVDATTRRIYLVTKPRMAGQKVKVYELPWPNRAGRKAKPLKAIATLKIPNTTAMDISPDGLRAVVLTYGNAYEYARGPDETWAQGFARQPRVIPMPRRSQGESICYGPDGKTLYLTSEDLPTPLWEVAPKGAK